MFPRMVNGTDDIRILREVYDSISKQKWQEYIAFAEKEDYSRVFSYKEKSCLERMEKNAGTGYRPADKDIIWGLTLVEKIENIKKGEKIEQSFEKSMSSGHGNSFAKHVTFRVAWHDNKWNGTICKDPLKNKYCSGFRSLLSERLRKRKAEKIKSELDFKGQPVSENYLPPCFWGINVFGEKTLKVTHDNPAEPRLEHIKEELPPQSLFSWPFALSFTRTKQEETLNGSYPQNLESVRVPKFQSKIQPNQSVAFIYTNISNPLSEEDGEFLVVGCGLVSDKGSHTNFTPQSLIDEKRKSPKLKNFPSMNWALRYSFENTDLLIRMPYHEYIDHFNRSDLDEDTKQKVLDKIKVSISEPELVKCFKYVAMDIDDDEAIYILSKIRKQLIECRNDGVVDPVEMDFKIEGVEELLKHCWKKRTYFPGFSVLCRLILDWDRPDFKIDNLLLELHRNEGEKYPEKLVSLFKNPSSDNKYKDYKNLLEEVAEKCEACYGLSKEDCLRLSLLNLKKHQFERILNGNIAIPEDWRDNNPSHSPEDICKNPYLLYEDYNIRGNDLVLDSHTGEEKDSRIELFKIDIAFFPDSRVGVGRIDLQKEIRINDHRRLRAVVLSHLNTLENTGHCFIDAEELEEAVKDYPLFYNLDAELKIPQRFFERISSDFIGHFEEDDKIKVVSENDTKYFYLGSVFKAESGATEIIKRLAGMSDLSDVYGNFEKYLGKSVKDLSGKIGNQFNSKEFIDERKALYTNLYKKRVFVVAGNPGSGKSHELLNIIKDFVNKGQKYLLLTPTGKAALRLKTDPEFPEIEAITIDKFFAENHNNPAVIRENINRYNNIIIDEMSMVDLMKFQRILCSLNLNLPEFKRLILVGDPNQLPAIGYGKILKDVLYYFRTHTASSENFVELAVNCRQELEENKVLKFSEGYATGGEIDEELKEAVLSGVVEISKGFRVRFWSNEEELCNRLDEEFNCLCRNIFQNEKGSLNERLNKMFGLNLDGSVSNKKEVKLENFQILSPYRSNFYGAGYINNHIQENYKPELELEFLDDLCKQSDKVICTKNHYDDGELILSNGSIGIVKGGRNHALFFPELGGDIYLKGSSALRKTERENFELAYAITVHKAQGSGFNHCFLILPKKLSLLSRELVYTALTRSKESITLFIEGVPGESFEESILEKARNRSYSESRRTSLLLDKPFRYYNLEVDGIFINSRVELLIYQMLKQAQKDYGNDLFSFAYELKPTVNGEELPMKTDFTIMTPAGTFYWEHLGLLGSRKYEWTWREIKRPTYEKYQIIEQLVTTDEKNGINPDKIRDIINAIVSGDIKTEDEGNRYSLHHYSLR